MENQHLRSRPSASPVPEVSSVIPTNRQQSVESFDFFPKSNQDTSLSVLAHQPNAMDDDPPRSIPADRIGLSSEGGANVDTLAHSNGGVVHGVVIVETRPTASKRSSELCLTIPQSDFRSSPTALCSSPDLGSTNKELMNPFACPSPLAHNPRQTSELRVRGSSFRDPALNWGALASTFRQNHSSSESRLSSKATITPASAIAGIVSSHKSPSGACPRGGLVSRGQAISSRCTLPNEILRRVKALIDGNPVSFFLDYCPHIYGAWLSSLVSTADSDSLQCLIAAFDSVLSFFRDRERMCSEISGCMPLRFGYVQLVAAIDTFNTEAKNAGKRVRDCYSRAAIPIQAYLDAKGMSNDDRKRTELTTLVINARRFRDLAGLSPIMLSIYSMEADRIVYVTLPYSLHITA
jgi:hypothetical protein